MPRAATGTVYERNGRWYVRVSLGGKRPAYDLGTIDEAAAKKRGAIVAALARTLAKSGQAEIAPAILRKAAAATEKELATLTKMVNGGRLVKQGSTEGLTIRELGKLYTSGELAKRYPRHRATKVKKTIGDDERQLRLYVYPIVGDIEVARFTRDHADQVLAALPDHLGDSSARHVALALTKVLKLAAEPMRLIGVSPIPHGWVPQPTDPESLAKSYLYPSDDRDLLGSTEVPLVRRLAYGLLAREGFRKGELLALRWRDLDLERGVITLDENKTKRPRLWPLGPDVVEGLKRWRELTEEPLPEDRVIPMHDIRSDDLRDALQAAGVEREQLFDSTGNRLAMRVHDLRATFVTLALATGKPEEWVRRRTGHTSSALKLYERTAKTFAELQLGWLAPLHEAIPELRSVTGSVTDSASSLGPVEGNLNDSAGGPEGDRTPDLVTASHALSQLSYRPLRRRVSSAFPPTCPCLNFLPRLRPRRLRDSRAPRSPIATICRGATTRPRGGDAAPVAWPKGWRKRRHLARACYRHPASTSRAETRRQLRAPRGPNVPILLDPRMTSCHRNSPKLIC